MVITTGAEEPLLSLLLAYYFKGGKTRKETWSSATHLARCLYCFILLT